LAGVFHTSAVQVVAGLFDRFEPGKQKVLIYRKPLRMKQHQIETICAYRSLWLDGEPQHLPRGRSLRWPWSTFAPFLQSPAGGPAHPLFSPRSSASPVQKHDGLPKYSRLTYSHENIDTCCITSNIRSMVFFNISVSSWTISSSSLATKGKIRCNRSKRPDTIRSYLFCSFKS
jgi:hypothetical protein